MARQGCGSTSRLDINAYHSIYCDILRRDRASIVERRDMGPIASILARRVDVRLGCNLGNARCPGLAVEGIVRIWLRANKSARSSFACGFLTRAISALS